MIQVNNVSLKFGKRTLFEDVNIKFTNGNCYGLIGANGSGKSTFLKLLSGELETTTGEIIISKGERLSILKQDHYEFDDKRVIDVVIMGNTKLYEIMTEPINGSGFNPKYGMLGSNKSTEERLKLLVKIKQLAIEKKVSPEEKRKADLWHF